MSDTTLRIAIAVLDLPRLAAERVRTDERGEGVISTAIAVLIMAGLGLAMWLAFRDMWQGAEGQIGGQIDQIGGGG